MFLLSLDFGTFFLAVSESTSFLIHSFFFHFSLISSQRSKRKKAHFIFILFRQKRMRPFLPLHHPLSLAVS